MELQFSNPKINLNESDVEVYINYIEAERERYVKSVRNAIISILRNSTDDNIKEYIIKQINELANNCRLGPHIRFIKEAVKYNETTLSIDTLKRINALDNVISIELDTLL